MRKYRVTQSETWIRTVEVDADSEDEAMAILEAGDWTFEMDNLELSDSDAPTCEEILLGPGGVSLSAGVLQFDELERFARERGPI